MIQMCLYHYKSPPLHLSFNPKLLYNHSNMNFTQLFRLSSMAVCGLASSTVWASPEPPFYQIIRGEYQDKIRRYSPPQKIFQVFAQLDQNKKLTLNMKELLKTICFYNYSQQDYEKSQNFEPENIKTLMGKGDKFNIYDYFNFARFISFSRDKFKQFYVDKNIQRLNRDGFVELILEHVCKDRGQFIRKPIYMESRQFNPNQEQYLTQVNQMADSLFAEKDSYTYQELVDFRLKIMKELYTFQYRTFKTDHEDYIDGVDFARSIVKYAENNHKRRFLKRIKSIEQRIKDIKISESDYTDFHLKLRLKQKQLINSLNQKGAMNQQDLQRLFNECGQQLNKGQLKVFFQLLDADNSQFIEKKEVLGVIEQLGYYWNVKAGENNLTELARKRLQGFFKKAKRIADILMQQ